MHSVLDGELAWPMPKGADLLGQLRKMPIMYRLYHGTCRIGHRDVVGFGVNGSYNYQDDPHFPMPAIRFAENTPDILALREKEKGDWKLLNQCEKKLLYRASFCQTFSEFKHPTGEWKLIVGVGLIAISYGFWFQIYLHHCVFDPLPDSFTEKSRAMQLRRMLDLHVNDIDGLSSKWDYKNDKWK